MGFKTEEERIEYFKQYKSLNPKGIAKKKKDRKAYKLRHPDKVAASKKTYRFRQKLKKNGFNINECNRCKITQEECLSVSVNGLEIHHKDRNQLNNEINNIEILCARCHNLEHSIDVINNS